MIALLTRGTRQSKTAPSKVVDTVANELQPPVTDSDEKPLSEGQRKLIDDDSAEEDQKAVTIRRNEPRKQPMLSPNDDDSSDDDV